MVAIDEATAPADGNLELDPNRFLDRDQRHFAVIDIGSNSIRLVVYDDHSRAPFPRFNEKSICALGAGIDESGNLSADSIDRAVHAVQRFVAIAKAMHVDQIDVIATEATRRARNGAALVDAIREDTGLATTVLSGTEEAVHSALGVLSGFYRPMGLVGDIGGGSLEVAEILGDRVGERVISMPLGALPVKAMMAEGVDVAKRRIDEILQEQLPPLLTEPVFYAVGGGWRALARVHIATSLAPIGVVHGYEIAAADARALAKKIARMSRAEVEALPDVPSRRIDTIPAAALLMSRVLRALKPERVIFSALGLREGWLYASLAEAEQQRDPLVEGAQSLALPTARVPEFSAALVRWTEGLFPGETLAERRLRIAVCALTDMSWRDHAKVRAIESFRRLLHFPFIGVSHAERAFIAVAILARYGGKLDDAVRSTTGYLLNQSQMRRAEILGRALLLGHRFSGSVPEILDDARFRIDADAVRLEVYSTKSEPDSDAVRMRLRQLAKASGIEGAEVVQMERPETSEGQSEDPR